MRLVAGLSAKSTEPSRALSTLAGQRGEAGFTESVKDFQRSYGFRAVVIELAEPTLAEVPGLLTALLRDETNLRHSDHDKALAQEREKVANQARAALSGANLATFEAALGRAVKAYPLREDNVFYTIDGPVGVARTVVLEAGRRLVEAGHLESVDDVFFVEVDEAAEALSSGRDLRPSATENRNRHQVALDNPGPPSYGRDPGPPPSSRWLPPAIREMTDRMQWGVEQILEQQSSGRMKAEAADLLTGVAASKGSYRGKVRLIQSEADFDRLVSGEVLVCPSTRPSWSVLFPLVGAIVTDSGGALSRIPRSSHGNTRSRPWSPLAARRRSSATGSW